MSKCLVVDLTVRHSACKFTGTYGGTPINLFESLFITM